MDQSISKQTTSD